MPTKPMPDFANAAWERMALEAAVEEGRAALRRGDVIPNEVIEADTDRRLAELRARREADLGAAQPRKQRRRA